MSDLNIHIAPDTRHLFIETYGCQMNVADSEVVASIMEMAGYKITDSIEDADAILLNTCSIRDNAEQKIVTRLQYLASLRRNNTATVTFPRMTLMMRPATSPYPLFAGSNDVFKVVITKTSDGVSDIAVDDNASAEYYNLRGVRVETPRRVNRFSAGA